MFREHTAQNQKSEVMQFYIYCHTQLNIRNKNKNSIPLTFMLLFFRPFVTNEYTLFCYRGIVSHFIWGIVMVKEKHSFLLQFLFNFKNIWMILPMHHFHDSQSLWKKMPNFSQYPSRNIRKSAHVLKLNCKCSTLLHHIALISNSSCSTHKILKFSDVGNFM